MCLYCEIGRPSESCPAKDDDKLKVTPFNRLHGKTDTFPRGAESLGKTSSAGKKTAEAERRAAYGDWLRGYCLLLLPD